MNSQKKTEDIRWAEKIAQYNLGNLIRGMADPSFSGCGLEMEVGQELARRGYAKPSGILIPFEVLNRGLTVGSPTGGGHTVATNLLAKNFIELLRPVSIVSNLGATYLSGLSGKVAVPRLTGTSSAYWVAENGAPTESAPAFDQVTMEPKTLAAYSDISRKMLLQSSVDVSSFVISDLRASLGQELDRAVLGGSGSSNQPLGILSNSGINTLSLGADGAHLSVDNLIDLETMIAQSNADGLTMAYVTTKQVRGALNKLKTSNGEYPYAWKMPARQMLPGEGVVNGLRAVSTQLMPSDLTKGSGTGLSSMICGNWSDLLVAQWGAGIDITIDPYVHSTTGAVRIVAMTDVDYAVRHPEAFVKVTDILTT